MAASWPTASGVAQHPKTLSLDSSHVNTQVFWSPEFCQRRYSFPADTWASGVVMYGLLDATFPFRDEKQIQVFHYR